MTLTVAAIVRDVGIALSVISTVLLALLAARGRGYTRTDRAIRIVIAAYFANSAWGLLEAQLMDSALASRTVLAVVLLAILAPLLTRQRWRQSVENEAQARADTTVRPTDPRGQWPLSGDQTPTRKGPPNDPT